MSQQLAIFQKPKEITEFLTRGKGEFARALPKHLDADRLIRLAVTAWSTNPNIRQCSGQSIMASLMVAAQIGLEPGVAGQGYLIPYKSTCTFVPGWQGLVGLLNNSGRATAWTGAVFEGDEWQFQLGSAPICRHIPGPNFGDPDKMIWVYACGKVNGSEQPVVEAWPMSRVWRHRDRFNKVGQKHYSFQHPEMYARKVVLLQVLKYMPRSIELNNAIVASDAAEIGRATNVQEGLVIEMPEEIPAANIGGRKEQQTPLEDAHREQTQTQDAEYVEGGDAGPEPEANTGPTAEQSKAAITKSLANLNVGKVKLNKVLRCLKIIGDAPASWDTQDAATLLIITERWEEIAEMLKNPPEGLE